MNIDVSILRRIPQLDVKAQLVIEPLAPLSMVAYIPGAYYKTVQIPTKKMLCGIFENVLGWHFTLEVRKEIRKDMKESYKKQGREDVKSFQEGSTYEPLLMEYFEIEDTPQVKFDSVCFYNDLWSRLHSRIDSPERHIKGCRNFDKNVPLFLHKLEELDKNKDLAKEEKKKYRKQICESEKYPFPFYYPIPTKREYIHLENGRYVFNVVFDNELLDVLEKRLETYNMAYLGNSEGWIDITLKRL